MRLFILVFLLSSALFSDFFPKKIESVIEAISNQTVTLSNPLLVGMSGVVIHNYGKGFHAITTQVVQTNHHKTRLLQTAIAPHESLPDIQTKVKVGDRVIGGYLYDNVLLLAPNAQVYATITSHYQKKWIHPDLFALFLAKTSQSVPTRKNLKAFAQKYQVGVIYIVRKNDEILLDAVSGKIVAKQPSSYLASKRQSPFYMRFKSLDNSWFFKDELEDYNTIMESL